MWKSNGQIQVTCWNCRRLNEDASLLQVDPAHLKVWRASAWARIGWSTLVCIIGGAAVGLFAFGGAMIRGVDIARICDIAVGSWLVATSMFALTAVAYCYDHSLADLRQLQMERGSAAR